MHTMDRQVVSGLAWQRLHALGGRVSHVRQRRYGVVRGIGETIGRWAGTLANGRRASRRQLSVGLHVAKA